MNFTKDEGNLQIGIAFTLFLSDPAWIIKCTFSRSRHSIIFLWTKGSGNCHKTHIRLHLERI